MSPRDGVVVVSASSISTTPAATGCHVLKINGYSEAKKVMSNGTSCEFEAAGHTWYIRYYPNGRSYESAGHISIYLRLADRDVGGDTATNARFRFSLLVPHHRHHLLHGGAPPPPPPPYGESRSAEFGRTMASSGHGFPCFVKHQVLERSGYLQDDCFAVRCDVDVVQMSAAPDAATVNDEHGDMHCRLGLPCCSCDGDDGSQCKRCAVEATPPQRHRGSAWLFRLFGCGKFR